MSPWGPKSFTPAHAEGLEQGLLEALPGGVVYMRADGDIAFANAEAKRILGLPAYESADRRVLEDFAPDTLREDGSPCAVEDYPVTRALATGEPQPPMTVGVRQKDGSISWAVFRATPVRDADNTLLGAIVTFLDITDRKRAEEELERSQALLRKAQELAHVGSWEWTKESNSVRWTQEMHHISGVALEDFDGSVESALRTVHPEDVERVRERLQALLKGERHHPLEYRVVHPDGSLHVMWGVGEVVCDNAGHVVKVVGAVQDVTGRRELEEQLRLMHRMESIGQFAGGIAHDFNNLLQVILGNAEMDAQHGAPSGHLREIRVAAGRAAQLTRQLLTFSRGQPSSPEPVSPAEILGDLEAMLGRMLAPQVHLRVTTEGTGGIRADRNQLEQVLINLCLNARDAMPQGGTIHIGSRVVQPTDVLGLEQAPYYVEFSVTDTGVGMAPELQSRVFEPFFTTKEVGQGTGLGLSVVYGIVKQHGGRVDVESRAGVGSSFRVILPGAEVSEPARSRVVHATKPRGTETVLVVEDDPLVLELVSRVLREAGYKVVTAESGQRALEVLQARDNLVSLVLTDIIMPGMTGEQLGVQLRVSHPALPVLYATGYATEQQVAAVGEANLIRKPYSAQELLERVRAMLDQASDRAS